MNKPPLWFYHRHRGSAPWIVIRREYSKLSETEIDLIARASYEVIIPLIGIVGRWTGKLIEPRGHSLITPNDNGGYSSEWHNYCPQYKALTFPLDKRDALLSGLTAILGAPGIEPDNLQVA